MEVALVEVALVEVALVEVALVEVVLVKVVLVEVAQEVLGPLLQVRLGVGAQTGCGGQVKKPLGVHPDGLASCGAMVLSP